MAAADRDSNKPTGRYIFTKKLSVVLPTQSVVVVDVSTVYLCTIILLIPPHIRYTVVIGPSILKPGRDLFV